MFEIILALLLGCIAGIVAGLLPGLHANTVAIILVGGIDYLSNYFSMLGLCVFLISMICSQSFFDFIPSIFLGAPEEETALSVLPGHKMLLKGEGYKALKLTVVGGVGSFLVGLAFLPLFYLLIVLSAPYLNYAVAPIVLAVSVIFILIEKGLKKKIWAALIFMLSGVLGLVVLNNLSVKQPLFPLLSGFFGISTLLISLQQNEKIVKQKFDDKINFSGFGNLWCYLKSMLSAALVSVMPAIGPAQATLIAQGFNKFRDDEKYMIIIGGINTVAALFVLTTSFLLNKARSGVMAAVQQILILDWHAYFVLLAVSFLVVGISAALTLKIGKLFAKNISRFNYRRISFGIIIFILVLIAFFSGPLGLFIASVATSIGIIAPKVGIKRIHAMGCLVIPIIFYFI